MVVQTGAGGPGEIGESGGMWASRRSVTFIILLRKGMEEVGRFGVSNVKRCKVVAVRGTLDAKSLVERGGERNINVVVKRTGAMQDTRQASN